MSRMRVFSVLGAGAGGQAIAGLLALSGADVRIWNRSHHRLEAIAETGGVYLEGAVSGHAPMALVTDDLAQAVLGSDVIMIVMPATAHWPVAQRLAQLLEPGQIIVLNPGRTGGAFEVRRAISGLPHASSVLVAEAQTLLVASRLVGPARCRIFSIKKSVGVAAVPHERTVDVLKALNQFLPQFYAASSVLETSLDNMGAIFHPGVTLLNSARIEATAGAFDYYHEGVTPSVARVIGEIDGERVRVARQYGVRTRTAHRWLRDAYGAEGQSLYQAVQSNAGYSGIKAPEGLDTRYLWEDVPTSLVPISELGRLAQVETPIIDATISLCSALHGIDYRAGGRTASRMGIEGLGPEEVLEFANSGDVRRAGDSTMRRASDDGSMLR